METTSKNRSAFAIVAAVIVLAVGVFGGYFIGHDASTPSDDSATVTSVAARASATHHNQADLTFTQMMVPHHSQALDMAKLAATRASSPAVKTLAANIEAAQQPEIDKMSSWVKSWGGPMGMGHSSMSEGMMSQSDMSGLAKMSGSAFDREFLTMMIGHHTGAIQMAQNELTNGENSQALALATSIQVTQQAEVNQMKGLLNQ